MIEIRFNKLEEASIRFRAEFINKEYPVNNDLISRSAPLRVRTMGIAGEEAFARYCNIYPNMQFADESEDKPDFVINGICYDVKWSPHSDRWSIRARPGLYRHIDRFVMVAGELPVMYLVGWIGRDDAMADSHLADVGCGPFYRVYRAELSPIELLSIE